MKHVRPLVPLLLLAVLLPAPAADAKRRAVSVPTNVPAWTIHDAGAGFVSDLFAAADGAVWFSGSDVGRVQRDGTVELLARGQCGALYVGGDGTAWCARVAADDAVDTIRRIEGNGTITDIPVREAAGIRDLIGAADGSIVFTEGAKDRIGRLAGGAIQEFPLPPSLASPGPLAKGADGAIWFAARRAVARILADGVFDEHRADALFAGRAAATGFTSMTAGSDGTFWLGIRSEARTSGRTIGGAIARMTVDGTFAQVASFGFLRSPRALAAAPDGSIWIIVDDEMLPQNQTLARLRPDGEIERYPPPQRTPFAFVTMTSVVVDDSGIVSVGLSEWSGRAAVARMRPPR